MICALLGGCASPATVPSVAALPLAGKPPERFFAEDRYCRRFAYDHESEPASAAASSDRAVGTAVATTAGGAALGAVIGSTVAHMGPGALIGAAYGLVIGTQIAAAQAHEEGVRLQSQFDTHYLQCMYAYGNAIPGAPVYR